MWFKGHHGDVVLGANSALFDLRSSSFFSWMSVCKRRGEGFRAHRLRTSWGFSFLPAAALIPRTSIETGPLLPPSSVGHFRATPSKMVKSGKHAPLGTTF